LMCWYMWLGSACVLVGCEKGFRNLKF